MSGYIKDIFGPVEPIEVALPEVEPEYIPEEIEAPEDEISWEDYLAPNEIEDISDIYNSPVGEARQVSEDVCKSVLASAAQKYSHLSDLDIKNALEWDLHGFLEYATLGYSNSFDFDESYAQYLTSGHPHDGVSSIRASALWVSGAPEVSESSREVLVASIVPSSNEYEMLHARTRLSQLIEAGKLSETTISYLSDLTTTN
jgi:hypothetical protein